MSDLYGWHHIVAHHCYGREEEGEEEGRGEGGEAREKLKDDTFLRASQEALECVMLCGRPVTFLDLEQ